MLPFEKAEMGRPDGVNVTESVSTRSTYSSLLVWRTLERRQGIWDPALDKAGARDGLDSEDIADEDELRAGEVLCEQVSKSCTDSG